MQDEPNDHEMVSITYKEYKSMKMEIEQLKSVITEFKNCCDIIRERMAVAEEFGALLHFRDEALKSHASGEE